MKRQANWSPMHQLLFISLVPVVAVVGTLLLISFLRSQPDPAPSSAPRASLTPQGSAEESRSAEREAFRDCLRSMGADFGGTQFRSRFSPPPDAKAIRDAMSVCRTLLDTAGGPPGTPRTQTTLPVA